MNVEWTSASRRPRVEAKDVTVEPRYAYHAEVAPGVLDLWTRHPFFTWWWCDRGEARVRIGRREHRVHPGQWALFPPHQRRHQRIRRGTVLVSVSFQAVWPSGVPLLEMPGPLVVDGQGYAALRRAARGVGRAVGSESGSLGACRLRGRLYLFVADLLERAVNLGCELTAPSSGDGRLDWVLREMRSGLRAGPLPMEAWSRRVGLSRSQLDRLCRRLLGMSLRQRRDQLLLDELRQRLATGSESIKELAAALGFVDTAHLCRWVRRHTGRSPTEIRQDLVT